MTEEPAALDVLENLSCISKIFILDDKNTKVIFLNRNVSTRCNSFWNTLHL